MMLMTIKPTTICHGSGLNHGVRVWGCGLGHGSGCGSLD